MQKSEVKQKQEQIRSSFSFLDFGLYLYRVIPSSLCCPKTFQLWTESWFLWPEHPKVNSTIGCSVLDEVAAQRGNVTLLQRSCVLLLHFPNFGEGKTYMYLLHYTPRLFSAQSFHKSSNINQREDFILNAQQRVMREVQYSWDILDITRWAESSKAQIIRKTINDFD